MAIRLVLAEDSFLVREGIRRLLAMDAELDVVATCGDLDALMGAVEAAKPDVVLTDIRMPPTERDEGIQAARRLRETSPEVGVVVLSHYSQPGYALALLEDGSEGRAYLLKERVEDLEQLTAAIRTVGGCRRGPPRSDRVGERCRLGAAVPLLRALRPLDGLPGVPAQPHPRALRGRRATATRRSSGASPRPPASSPGRRSSSSPSSGASRWAI